MDIVKSVKDALDLRKVILNYSNISINRHYEKIIQCNLTRYVEISADVEGRTAAAVMKAVKKAIGRQKEKLLTL